MQINALKSKVMAFHETPAQKRKRKEQIKHTRSASQPTYPPPFHILAAFPSHRQCSHLIEEVQAFDYLGLRLDPKLKMTSALHRIQEKVNKSNALVFAVSHSLRYDDSSHRHRPSINATPQEIHEGVDAGVCPLAPYIHDEASVPPRHPTTPTSFGV
jgi:hypothetical protein